jgi:hypothetical protein
MPVTAPAFSTGRLVWDGGDIGRTVPLSPTLFNDVRTDELTTELTTARRFRPDTIASFFRWEVAIIFGFKPRRCSRSWGRAEAGHGTAALAPHPILATTNPRTFAPDRFHYNGDRACRMHLLVAWTLLFSAFAFGQTGPESRPNLSGNWRQDNERCLPKRTGDVRLTIQHRDPVLVIETTSKGQIARQTSQRYTTDGVESVSTGADGDEFHSAVAWKDGDLVFEIVELEDGKRLKSTEVWSLIDGGGGLKRVRHTQKSGDQTLIYVRTR